MSLPKTISDIIRAIHAKLEIAPEKDRIIAISLWDFQDQSGDTIPKGDMKSGLKKLAEDEKLFQLKDIRCLDKLGRFSGEEIKIEIDRERFVKFYKKHLQEQKAPIGNIEFLDDEALLKLGDKKCPLPPYKNEHFFCQAAFEHPINEPIDWSIIYEKMTGYYEKHFGKTKDTRENWHQVYDTMEAINKRAEELLNIEKLFVWREKSIKRTR
ncbi:MAG: hypothetical protein WC297_01365 [Candidatus Paceibacterota bacterium]|jgi:hypothetical protein